MDYPFTHELRELLELGSVHHPLLENFAATVPEYTEFAVRLRYDDLPWVTREEAETALAEVERMKQLLAPYLPAA